MTNPLDTDPNLRFPLDVTTHPAFEKFDVYGQQTLKLSAAILNIAIRSGYLNLSTVRKIADFGAGDGRSTVPLVQLAEQTNGSVDALELFPRPAQKIIDRGILPTERVHIGDGLRFLEGTASRGEAYDLISAAMLAPVSFIPTERFLGAASRALASEGRLLMRSDVSTMLHVEEVCDQQDVSYHQIRGRIALSTPALIISSVDLDPFRES